MGKTIVLLVEDNAGHAVLVREAFKKYNGDIQFYQLSTGEEALVWLGKQWADVILLDLNLPGMYGLEVLKRLKGHHSLRSIPVIILTTSQVETEIVAMYEAQAACYIVKPVNYQKWEEAIQCISGLYKMAAKVR